MDSLTLTAAITRLFAALPLMERIDIIVGDAVARGLEINAISLDAEDFETFRVEGLTHMLISVADDGGSFRDHVVRLRPDGESQIDATMPDGSRAALSICPDFRTIAKTTGQPCAAAAAWTGQTV